MIASISVITGIIAMTLLHATISAEYSSLMIGQTVDAYVWPHSVADNMTGDISTVIGGWIYAEGCSGVRLPIGGDLCVQNVTSAAAMMTACDSGAQLIIDCGRWQWFAFEVKHSVSAIVENQNRRVGVVCRGIKLETDGSYNSFSQQIRDIPIREIGLGYQAKLEFVSQVGIQFSRIFMYRSSNPYEIATNLPNIVLGHLQFPLRDIFLNKIVSTNQISKLDQSKAQTTFSVNTSTTADGIDLPADGTWIQVSNLNLSQAQGCLLIQTEIQFKVTDLSNSYDQLIRIELVDSNDRGANISVAHLISTSASGYRLGVSHGKCYSKMTFEPLSVVHIGISICQAYKKAVGMITLSKADAKCQEIIEIPLITPINEIFSLRYSQNSNLMANKNKISVRRVSIHDGGLDLDLLSSSSMAAWKSHIGTCAYNTSSISSLIGTSICLTCLQGSFLDIVSGQCVEDTAWNTNDTCARHLDFDRCIDCDRSIYYQSKTTFDCRSLPSCPQGHFSEITATAKYCSPLTHCSMHEKDAGGSCSCKLSDCQSCLLSSCDQCKPGYWIEITGLSKSCVTAIPEGYSANNLGILVPCLTYGCTSCNNTVSACTYCQEAMHLNLTTGLCSSCEAGCLTCTNDTSCQKCDTGLLLYRGNCIDKCPVNYCENQGICNPVSLKVIGKTFTDGESNQQVTLVFNYSVAIDIHKLSTLLAILTRSSTDFTTLTQEDKTSIKVVSATVINNNSVNIGLDVQSPILKASLYMVFSDTSLIHAIDDNEVHISSTEVKIIDVTHDGRYQPLDHTQQTMIQVTAVVITSSLGFVSLSNFMSLVRLLETVDLFIYINMDRPVSFDLVVRLLTENPLSYFPNYLTAVGWTSQREIKPHYLPQRIKDNGIDVGLAENMGRAISICLTIIGVSVLVKLLSLIPAIKKKIANKLPAMIGVEFWFSMLEVCHLDIIFTLLVGMTNLTPLALSIKNASTMASEMICYATLILLIVAYITLYFKGRSVSKKSKLLSEVKHDKPGLGSFEFLISDKVRPLSFLKTHYNLISLLKDWPQCLLIYYAYDMPALQLSGVMVTQIAIFGLNVWTRPFDHWWKNTKSALSSGLFCIMALLFYFMNYRLGVDTRDDAMWYYGSPLWIFVVVLVGVNTMVSLTLSLIDLIKMLRSLKQKVAIRAVESQAPATAQVRPRRVVDRHRQQHVKLSITTCKVNMLEMVNSSPKIRIESAKKSVILPKKFVRNSLRRKKQAQSKREKELNKDNLAVPPTISQAHWLVTRLKQAESVQLSGRYTIQSSKDEPQSALDPPFSSSLSRTPMHGVRFRMLDKKRRKFSIASPNSILLAFGRPGSVRSPALET